MSLGRAGGRYSPPVQTDPKGTRYPPAGATLSPGHIRAERREPRPPGVREGARQGIGIRPGRRHPLLLLHEGVVHRRAAVDLVTGAAKERLEARVGPPVAVE